MASKFNLIEALENDGFKTVEETEYEGAFQRKATVLEKRWEKIVDPEHYNYKVDFEASIIVITYGDGVAYARACYSNGKVKDHADASKRTYNAIRDTVRFHGFEMAQ